VYFVYILQSRSSGRFYVGHCGSSRICVYPIASNRRLGRASEGIWQNHLRQNNERKG